MEIVPLRHEPETIETLADMIIEAVSEGALVTFLHPLSREDAKAFWSRSLQAAEAGDKVVLGARDGGALIGTVSLVLDTPQNQRHRTEIVKLIIRRAQRGRGVARALMQEAERVARANGRFLLHLDTATRDGAAGLYEKLGYIRAGSIPDYALTPLGELCGTILFYKRLG